jgi:hypothetical protein
MKENVMTSKITTYLTAAAVVLIVLCGAVATNAQRREARGRMMTKPQVKAVINRLETRLDAFKKQYDKSLDKSRLNGSDREDWLNKRAKDLEHATDDLRKHFDVSDRWIENKDDVQRCIDIARDIDKNIRGARYGAATESNWANVRRELNTLADIYNIAGV